MGSPSSQSHPLPGVGCLPSLALDETAAGRLWAQYTSRVWIPPPQTGPVSCQSGSCCSRRRETWHSFHSEVLQEYLFGLFKRRRDNEEKYPAQKKLGNDIKRAWKSFSLCRKVSWLWVTKSPLFPRANHTCPWWQPTAQWLDWGKGSKESSECVSQAVGV